MSRTFLHAPFSDPRLLAAMVGPGTPLEAATLEGGALGQDASGLRIGLVPGEAAVPGTLVALGTEQAARVGFAMASLGLVPQEVTIGGAPATAFALADNPVPVPAEAVDDPVLRAQLAELVVEILGHFGHRPAEAMPGLLHGMGIRAFARTQGALTERPTRLGAGFGPAEIEPLSRGFPYARYFGIEDHRLRHRRFDGKTSAIVDRAVFTSGDAVTVLPFDPRTGAVLLIEQFRAGPLARRDPHPWCLETVAGRRDRRESAEETARREAVEEAGVTLGRIERVGSFYPSPAIMAEYITAFVAEADLGTAGGVHGLAEEDEDIRTIIVPLDTALEGVEQGEIATAPLIISLLWLARHEARLRKAWG